MRILSEFRERLRALFFRSEEEQDLDEELRFHVEMEVEANIRRGLDPVEARRQALITFGGVERFKEEVREARGLAALEALVRDVRFALRRLVRESGFTVPVVLTLALGIGVTAAVFALVDGVLLRPLPYPAAERLVTVGHAATGMELPMAGLSPGIFQHYREQNHAFEEIAAYMEGTGTFTDLDRPEEVRRAYVSPELFTVLRAVPYLGRLPSTADVEPGFVGRELVISYDLWVRRYGADPGIVGRAVEWERRPREIVGVMPPGFHFPHPESQVWFAWPQAGSRASLRYLALSGVARLKPGVSPETARRELDRLVGTLPAAFPDITAAQLEDMGLHSVVRPLKDTIVGDTRVALLLLMATAGFLLLITWANAGNLCLVRAEHQRREVVLQRALGASSGALARRFLTEGCLLASAGGALGVALARVAIRVRFGFESEAIPRLGEVAMGGAVVGVLLALTVASAVLLGVLPLLGTRRADLARALAGGIGRMTAGRREQTGRRLLVAGQVALALMLLVGAALMAESYRKLQQVDLGFTPTGLLTLRLPVPPNMYNDYHAMARVHDEILGRLRALPGVDAVEAGNIAAFPLTPVRSDYNQPIARADQVGEGAGEEWPSALFSFATPGYFRLLGIPLLSGRTFLSDDTSREAPGVILSSALARTLFGDADPIGRPVRWASTSRYPAYTVVGIVGDVPTETIREGPSKVIYFPNLYPPRADTITGVVHIYVPDNEVYVLRTNSSATSLLPAIRRAVDEVDSKLLLTRIVPLEETVAASMAHARLTMLLLLVGAGTALLLGVVGIYGVLAYTVRRRTAELGVRLALGATPAEVMRMVVRQGALLALGGITAGLLVALALTRFLGSLLYEVRPDDPVAFGAMAGLLLAVALVASYLPARRAGRIDPARALRAE